MHSLAKTRLGDVSLLVLALVIGAFAAFGAVAFRSLINLFRDAMWPAGTSFLVQLEAAPRWMYLVVPAAAGLLVGPLLTYVVPEAKGPGVPEVILAIVSKGARIRHRVTALKALISSLLIAAGASVGREGPIVQIGASVGASLAGILRIRQEVRQVCLAAGAAAGISATFNAPIAGTLFALEVILLDIEVAYISPIVVASVTASVLSRLFWGEFSTFDVGPIGSIQPMELWVYLPLGLLGGLVGALFVRMIYGVGGVFDRIPLPDWLKPCLGGLLLGCLGLILPQVMGVGYDAANLAITGKLTVWLAVGIMLLKILATSVCIGSGMSGGIFAPSLVIGSSMGVLVGMGLEAYFPGINLHPAHYALAGMGAVVAATTLAPITAVMTAFELTANYVFIVPLMIACIASTFVYKLVYGYSAYELKLIKRGVNLVRGHDASMLRTLMVRDFMHQDTDVLHVDDAFSTIIHKSQEDGFPHFAVLDEKGNLAGVLSLRDLRPYLGRWDDRIAALTAAQIMSKEPVTISASASLEQAMVLFEERGYSFLPVTDPLAPRKMLGILRKNDLLHAYRERVLKDRVLSSPS